MKKEIKKQESRAQSLWSKQSPVALLRSSTEDGALCEGGKGGRMKRFSILGRISIGALLALIAIFSSCKESDTKPPTVSIKYPTDGAIVEDTTVVITAVATDNVEVVKVEFYVDEQPMGIDTMAPWLYEWNTTVYEDSSTHYIFARAYDEAENVGTSEIITVLVRVAGVNQPPNTPSNPSPANGAIDQDVNLTLSWIGGDPDPEDIVTYDIYLGTSIPPQLEASDQPSTSYTPSTLGYNTTYYWKVIARDNQGDTAEGPIWSFTTTAKENQPPYTPSNPMPPDGAIDQDVDIDLSWTGGDPDPEDIVTYDVYFGTTPSPTLIAPDQSITTYDPGTLNNNTTYYWKIVAKDNYGAQTEGPVWSFATIAAENHPPYTPSDPIPADGDSAQPIDVDLSWTGGDPDADDTVRYDIYFGSSSPPSLVSSDQTATTFDLGTLKQETKYYWRIVAEDNHGEQSSGPIWSFTTTYIEVEIYYDDGTPEHQAYIYNRDNAESYEDNQVGWAMRLTPPSYPFKVTKVKFMFGEMTYDFYLHIWDDDGANGGPGTELLHTPYLIDYSSVPAGQWWEHDVSSKNVIISSGSFYVGFCYSYLDIQGAPTDRIGADTTSPWYRRAWIKVSGYDWRDLYDAYEMQYDLLIRAKGYTKEGLVSLPPARKTRPTPTIKRQPGFKTYPAYD